jgi:hypothetical protein
LGKKHGLKRSKAPNSIDIQRLEHKGLALTFGETGELFSIQHDWGQKKMNAFLHEKLPNLFDILAVDDPWILTIDDDDGTPVSSGQVFPYVLLGKQQSTLMVTPKQEVTGPRVLQNRGRSGVHPSDTFLWIGKFWQDSYGHVLISITWQALGKQLKSVM